MNEKNIRHKQIPAVAIVFFIVITGFGLPHLGSPAVNSKTTTTETKTRTTTVTSTSTSTVIVVTDLNEIILQSGPFFWLSIPKNIIVVEKGTDVTINGFIQWEITSRIPNVLLNYTLDNANGDVISTGKVNLGQAWENISSYNQENFTLTFIKPSLTIAPYIPYPNILTITATCYNGCEWSAVSETVWIFVKQ